MASRRLFDGAQIELGLLPIEAPPAPPPPPPGVSIGAIVTRVVIGVGIS